MANSDFTLRLKAYLDSTGIQGQLRQISKSTKLHFTSDGSQLVTTTKLFRNNMGEVVKSTHTLNKATGKATSSFQTMAASTNKMKQGFGDIVLKVGKFLAATTLISGVTAAIGGAVTAVKELDDAMTEYKKVSSLRGKDLDAQTQKLSKYGEVSGRTTSEMYDAATQFKKSGYSDSQSATLAKTATVFQNIADSEMDAGTAAGFITSQMKAFNIPASKSFKIIDSVNEVSNNYAVSSTDLQSALSRTSSAMGALGNSYDETLGLVTAGTEIMQGQSGKVARGLRTIGNNIAGAGKKSKTFSYQVDGSTKTISLFNKKTGDMKNTYSVLGEMSKSWGKMSNKEKQALAITLAGKNQFEVFTSVLGNFKHAQEATQTSIHSSGSAMKENEAYTESLSYKLTMLKKEFKDLANSIINSGVAKGFVDIGVGALKFVSSDFAGAAIKIGLVTAAATGLFHVVQSFRTATAFASLEEGVNIATKLGQKFKNISTIFAAMRSPAAFMDIANNSPKTIAKINKLNKAIKFLKTNIWSIVGLGGIIGAGVLTTQIVKALDPTEKLAKATRQLKGDRKKLASATSELQELNSKPNKSVGDETRIEQLKEEIQLLKDDMALEQQKKQKAFEDSQKVKTTTGSNEIVTKAEQSMEKYNTAMRQADEAQDQYLKTGEERYRTQFDTQQKNANAELKNLKEIQKGYKDAYPDDYTSRKGYKDVTADIKKIEDSVRIASPELRAFQSTIEQTLSQKSVSKGDISDVIADTSKVDDAKTALQAYSDALKEGYSSAAVLKHNTAGVGKVVKKNGKEIFTLSQDDLPKLAKSLNLTEKATQALIERAGTRVNVIPTVKGTTKELKKQSKAIKGSKGAIVTSNRAFKKYAKSQGYSKKQTDELAKSFTKAGNKIVNFSGDTKHLINSLKGTDSGLGKLNKSSKRLQGFSAKKYIDSVKKLGGSAEDAKASIKKLHDEDLITDAQYKAAKERIDKVFKKDDKITTEKVIISANVDKFNEAVGAVQKKTMPKKKVNISQKGAQTVMNAVDAVNAKELTDKEATYTITVKTKKSGKSARGVRNSQKSFLSVVNDNPTGGKANGQYPELIRRANGDTFIANGGEEALVNIGKGDTVYTAKETRQMLSGRKQAIPHFAKGKKVSTSKKGYTKKYDKLQSRFQSKLDLLDYKLSTNQLTDGEYQKAYRSLVNSYNKKVRKLNKRYKVKGEHKNIGTSNVREQKQSLFEHKKDVAQTAIDTLTANYAASGNTDDFSAAYDKIIKTKKYMTNAEYKEYLSALYTAKAEHDIKMVKADANSYDAQKSNLDSYLNQGVISYEEYYNQLTELQSTYSSKVSEMYDNQKSLVQKTIDAHVKELEAEKDALSSSNDLLEKQNALATAQNKKVMVYKGGKWQWVASKSEVEEAERNLREAEIDSEIDKWNNILTDYEDKIETINAEKNSGGFTLTQLLSMSMSDLSDFAKNAVAGQAGAEAFSEWLETNGVSGDLNAAMDKSISDYIDGINAHATGTLSTEPLSIVGEKGAEMHVGSGDGIISSAMTKNLMEWGTMTPTQFANIQSASNDNHSVTQFNLGSGAIVVNGNNGKDIAEDIIMNFDRIAKQRTLQR